MKAHWMNTLAAIALLALPGSALAQVSVNVAIPVPSFRFEVAPVFIEAEPGVQVVEDYNEEIFLVDHWYWHRAGGRWYRSRSYRGGWVYVEPGYVPARIVRIPPGHYKHWKKHHARGGPHGGGGKVKAAKFQGGGGGHGGRHGGGKGKR